VFVKERGLTLGCTGKGLLTPKVGSLDDVELLKETLERATAVVSAAGSRRGEVRIAAVDFQAFRIQSI
jgi:hypothetical protein